MFPFPTFAINDYAQPGSQNFTTVGSQSFIVPKYTTSLTITLFGAGGGGGTVNPTGFGSRNAGGAGSASTVASLSLSAGGGSGGFTSATGGTASGGDTNTNGGANGNCPNGGSVGTSNNAGNAPGGGGGGDTQNWTHLGDPQSMSASNGGGGAYVIKTYSKDQLTPGSTLTLVVGTGGSPGAGGTASGARGEIRISWT